MLFRTVEFRVQGRLFSGRVRMYEGWEAATKSEYSVTE